MRDQNYSGQLGIVLLIDSTTTDQAIEIAARHKMGNSMDLGDVHKPHLTLYHSKLSSIPALMVEQLLDDLMTRLPLELKFTEVATFGGKFLFWDVECSSGLQGAHETSLLLADYFAQEGEQQADREGLELPEEERRNVEQFGHPLVKSLWRPHVTLGYYPDDIKQATYSEVFNGSAIGVAFVRVGEAGTIAEIIIQR